ncbi:hypothetical protein GTY57_28725 [Streptomyces sp. SID5475]|nr:hypothetical protein [Streptomyces sp. SID5475]
MAAALAQEAGELGRLSSALWPLIGSAAVKAARLRPGPHVLDALLRSAGRVDALRTSAGI